MKNLLVVRDMFTINEQTKLVQLVRQIVAQAPLYKSELRGTPFKYQQTGAGWGWVSGHGGGYRYQRNHPVTGHELPEIPAEFVHIAKQYGLTPDAMLINYYTQGSTLGLHQDKDEADLTAPVVSISIGDTCNFSMGPTRAQQKVVQLASGSVITLSGDTRMHWHGVNSIVTGTGPAQLLKNGGRINITLRKSQ